MAIVVTILGLLLAAALFMGFWYLLRERRCPVIVMRLWFVSCLVTVVIVLYLLCLPIRIARYNKWVSRQQGANIACWLSCLLMGKVLWFLSPHIHIKIMEGSLDPHGIHHSGVMCSCHTSFFDTILFTQLIPLSYMRNVKAFAKRSLWSLPFMGKVIDTCGHLPVYFTSTGGSFAVDKEKQALVAEEADEFVNAGGNLCVFPEGALNRTPETLKDFRLGTFAMITKHRSRLYYMVHNGCHEVWPPAMNEIPGFPADVYVCFGEYKYNEDSTAEDISQGLREVMQKHVNRILLLRQQARNASTEKAT
ncbi:acyltransferase, putative [Trypanosoma brucei gambiense DAL972]|uniref:Acyltransferase, putative n=3 Tax=Trypanosoma brucei TaxID=5691 RepID=Q582Q3_TRYB2|nr:acyltransferase, putative [Trypanosoma brucei gambiense DAL972]XP_844074.1 acyltransferase, putative [Trypanosoma brucei brucei TREU927]AAX80651.1 acyltransferase, putative [Trypanosoma brucei]RHW73429.1 acyltransferase [Trypanosoma brucei equiperdum]AAZ10515.1 acyltransferase, putative [Trypanosoma brucei brucei TREU927]CBH10197.1 acyltransferase, putative [Trypanosoma brucei gambiense DAL972]|eukprot:XP_011772487.1 acyltransferase, putative [Trypanosoma brucei gambiense DAL972]